MKLVLQPSKLLNWMQPLEDVLSSTVKCKAMRQRSSYHISNRALYHKKVEFPLGLNMQRLKNTRLRCMFAKENVLFMLKRQV